MSFIRKISALFRREKIEAEMAEEMRSHLELQAAEYVKRGMTLDEARYAAQRDFGGVEQIKERGRDERRRSVLWLDNFLQDLRYALRQIRKYPGFSAVVVLILGLGIGANTAVFSALEVLMFRSLPVPAPEELVVVTLQRVGPKGMESDAFLSLAMFDALREQAKSLSGVLTLNGSGGMRTLTQPGSAVTGSIAVKSSDVSGSYFSVLRVRPLLGRLIAPEDDHKNAAHAVAVISHALWQRQFSGDRDVVGKTVQIEKVPFEIIGVAPEGFSGVKAGEAIEIWTPLWMLPTVNPRFGQNLAQQNWRGLFILGRLRSGVTRTSAEAEVDLLYQQAMIAARPGVSPEERAKAWGHLTLAAGASGLAGDLRTRGGPILSLLLVVVLLVQVIACANVASLSLARLATRWRELAARTAMGAGRSRIVRQLLTEALLLVAGGAAVGSLLVLWAFLAVRGQGIEVRPNGWIFLFGFVLLVVTGAIVALVPAIRSSRIDLATALKSQSNTLASGGRSRLQPALVIIQLAVCGCLLTGTGYFVQTVQHLRGVDVGFEGGNLLLVNLETPSDYDLPRRTTLVQEVLQALNTAPGVSHATYSITGLLSGGTGQGPIAVAGYAPAKDEDMTMRYAFIGPDFFETIGLPVTLGRGLESADVFSPVRGVVTKAVVNQAMAQRFFGTTDPIGRHFKWGNSDDYEIVGVVQNAKYRSLREENPLICYLPWPRFPSPLLALQIRTTGQPRALVASLPAILRQVNPSLRVAGIQTMDDVRSRATRDEQMTALGVGMFSGLALLLTSLGLYGLLAYGVVQRTREIGVRIALGGRPANIIGMIVKQGLALTAFGWVTGVAAAMALVRLVASRLYGVSNWDPTVLLASAAVLGGVALFACWLPARRAAQVDPMVALRAE